MSLPAYRHHRWIRRQYEKMVSAGILSPEDRLELMDGSILDMTAQSSRHAACVRLVEEALRSAFSSGYDVRVQLPIALDDYSEPEPDVSVVAGSIRDYLDHHPTEATLIVEVTDSSVALDRGAKKSLYSRNRVPEYWILNLVEGVLEVHRNPERDSYSVRSILGSGDTVTPAATPGHPLEVAAILP